MKNYRVTKRILLLIIMTLAGSTSGVVRAQKTTDRDIQVKAFLQSMEHKWQDWNVPESDGKLLYDLIIQHHYTRAVEIGTSTGRSGIWIAWALSKTGGKLITIEIDKQRYEEALANFKKAGLSEFIDARLADAHTLVPELNGPIDFVFSDADKDWYTNYFKALDPKLSVGGCFTSHNIDMPGARDFFVYIQELPNYKTTADYHGAGMSISYKISNP